MRKSKSELHPIVGIITTILALVIFALMASSHASVTGNNARTYDCDYKTMNLFNTEIETVLDGETITIKGNVLRLLTDPLTVKDSKGNVIGNAGDAYGIFKQDDHGIYVGDTFDVNMCGKFNLFGNSYDIKNANGEIIATAKFNAWDTCGTITDTNGTIIAVYNRNFFVNDYKVTICDNDVCEDMSMLMIMASYVSDMKADSSSSSSSSSN